MDDESEQKAPSAALRGWVRRARADCHMSLRELDAIADKIDNELVELPRDRDGVPIHVGDTVYGCISGRKSQATGLRLEDAWVILTNHGFGEPHIFTHSSPDSWERIADELDDLSESGEMADETSADMRDLAERIRKLRELDAIADSMDGGDE